MKLAVCWKWVVGGADERWAHVSAADEAALEVALSLAGADDEVAVISLAPGAADATLRVALAAGATRIVRIDAPTTLSSTDVAAAISDVVADADLVLCGDHSLDRGSGSVPAFIAAEIGAAQALGLVDLGADHRDPRGRGLRVTRRLDGGRREILDVPYPAVISVEGSVASLRRASLAASLAARTATIEVVPGPVRDPVDPLVLPYRPRPRVIAGPTGTTLTRVRDILAIGTADDVHSESVTLDPPDAARRILDQLREWGYIA